MTAPRIEELRFLSPQEVRSIAERFGTPVYVYDEESMARAERAMSSLPSAFGLTVRYLLTACPSQAIIRVFDKLGTSFDAGSVWEALRAVRAGVDPARILLTAPDAVVDDKLRELVEAGLQFDADTIVTLEQFGSAFPGRQVSVRLDPGAGRGLPNRLTSTHLSSGIRHEELPEVVRVLKVYDLKLVRVHAHVGSGRHGNSLLQAARLLLGTARRFPGVRAICLGGGHRVTSLLDDPGQVGWASLLADEMRAFAAETGRELELELEPGTALMANSTSIITRVLDLLPGAAGSHPLIRIEGGVAEILRPSYYGAIHPLVSVAADGRPRGDTGSYFVEGAPHGDEPVPLARTEPGDFIVVERKGGYASGMTLKNFSSFPEAPEVLRRRDGSVVAIRVRQTLDHLVANERIPVEI